MPSAELAAIVDPFPAAAELAAQVLACRVYRSLAELFEAGRPDGVILATPNQLHVDGGLECVAAGVPVLVEKPIGDIGRVGDPAGRGRGGGRCPGARPGTTATTARSWPRAREIVAAAARWARSSRSSGPRCSTSPTTTSTCGGGWRRQPGGGPILLNLIHEVNNLMSLVGDIVAVQAVTSNATRGFTGRGHRGDGVQLRQRRARHVPAVRHRGLAPLLGADLAGEQELRQLTRTRTATTSPAPAARCRCRRCG